MPKNLVHDHNLPVTRVIYAQGNGHQEKTLLHMTNAIFKEDHMKHPHTYWRTDCGKSIDWQSFPHNNEFVWAMNNENGYSFCPRCGTPEEFDKAYEAEQEFDHLRKLEEDRKEQKERAERKARWDKMTGVLDSEIENGVYKRKVKKVANNSSQAEYFLVRGGVSYKVTISIQEEEK